MTTLIERITTLRGLVHDKSLTEEQRNLNAVKTTVLLERLKEDQGYIDLDISEDEETELNTKEILFFKSCVPYLASKILHEHMQLPINGEWIFMEHLIPYIVRKITKEFYYHKFSDLLKENIIHFSINDNAVIWGFSNLSNGVKLSDWISTHLHSEEIEAYYQNEEHKGKETHEIVRADLKAISGCKFNVSKKTASLFYQVCVFLMDSKERILTDWYTEGGRTPINNLSSDMLTEYGKYVINAMKFITNRYNYDRSDLQSDYYNVRYSTNIAIGNYKTDKPFSECKEMKRLYLKDYEAMVITMEESKNYELLANRLTLTLQYLTRYEFVFFVKNFFRQFLWDYDMHHDFSKELIQCFEHEEEIFIMGGFSFRVSGQNLIINFETKAVKCRLLAHFKIDSKDDNQNVA